MLKEYIKKSSILAQKNSKEKHLFDSIPVHVVSNFPSDVDLSAVLTNIEEVIPKKFASNIYVVYVGNFKDFYKNDRNFNAMYEDGALYISNIQDNKDDMIDDIVHELAHSVGEENYNYIYSDEVIKKEFLGKRERLYHILKQEDFQPDYDHFLKTEYNLNFDNYLYRKVGYQTLNMLIVGLFYSPYAITSLREYFANGFENYFLGEQSFLKEISPSLYNKIDDLVMNTKVGENYEV